MRVRDARPEDLDDLVEFNAAMALATEGRSLDRERLAAGVAALLADPDRGVYHVAEDAEGRTLGALMITREWSDWRNAWFWWIQSVFVVPEARGRGVYRGLYEHVQRRAAEAGDVCGLRLYVEQGNAVARAVYERLGMHAATYRLYEAELGSGG